MTEAKTYKKPVGRLVWIGFECNAVSVSYTNEIQKLFPWGYLQEYGSVVSCGVHQLSGVSGFTVEKAWYYVDDLLKRVSSDHGTRDKDGVVTAFGTVFNSNDGNTRTMNSKCGMFTFSDNMGLMKSEPGCNYAGVGFAKFLRDNKLGEIGESVKTRNPNSGNFIQSWYFVPDWNALWNWHKKNKPEKLREGRLPAQFERRLFDVGSGEFVDAADYDPVKDVPTPYTWAYGVPDVSLEEEVAAAQEATPPIPEIPAEEPQQPQV